MGCPIGAIISIVYNVPAEPLVMLGCDGDSPISEENDERLVMLSINCMGYMSEYKKYLERESKEFGRKLPFGRPKLELILYGR